MAGLDTLTITNSGIFNINRKIVDSRVFSSSLITMKGKVAIKDGIASSFSQENYLTFSPLHFIDSEKITINFKGTYTTSDHNECPLELIDSEGKALSLLFENSRVTLIYNERTIFSFGNLEFPEGVALTAYLTLKNQSYEFTLYHGKQVLQKTGEFNFVLPLNSFITLNIGRSYINPENVWEGEINLNELFIYNNETLLYCPSEGASWNFSYILISDGTNALTDTTEPTKGHIYKFPITEINRSGNSVLLTCNIDEDAHIVIKEIGLYIQTTSGPLLFGYINNLNINKTEDLSYNLILLVNTTISVLNAVGFPAENGIVVKDPSFVEFKDYTTVQQVNTYVLTNLERIVRMNAGAKGSYINSSIENAQAGIGYNRPQVIYKLQQELEAQEDCYNTIDTFLKLVNKLQELYDYQVNYSILEAHGGILIPETGKVSDFSTNRYITVNTPFTGTSSWNARISFDTRDVTHGTIMSLDFPTSTVNTLPLKLNVTDNKCHLKINSIESISVSGSRSSYFRNALDDTVKDEVNYYGWSRVEDTPMYNFHCSNLAISSSPVVSFPRSGITTIEHKDMDSSSFAFSVEIMFTNITGTQYIIGKPNETSENASFEILLVNGKLRAYLYDSETGNLIQGYMETIGKLKPNKYYIVSLSYDDETYTLRYTDEIEEEDRATESETVTMSSSERISLKDTNILVLGNRYNTTRMRSAGTFWGVPSSPVALQGGSWESIAWNGSKYVALNQNGYTATSTDGITWTTGGSILLSSGSSTIWKGIAYGNGVFVALSENGFISHSQDGISWELAYKDITLTSIVTGITWVSLAWSRAAFVAMSSSGYTSNSNNGYTWVAPIAHSELDGYNWVGITGYGLTGVAAISKEGYVSRSSDNGRQWRLTGAMGAGMDNWSAIINKSPYAECLAITSDGYRSISYSGEPGTWSTPVKIEELDGLQADWKVFGWRPEKGNISDQAIILSQSGLVSTSPNGSLQGEIDLSNTLLESNSETWSGATEMSLLYSASPRPTNQSTLYDEDFYAIQGSTGTYYYYTTIINQDIFSLVPSTKYTIDISYEEDNEARQAAYTVTYMLNDNESTKTTAVSQTSTIFSDLRNRMGIPSTTYLGISPDMSLPFSSSIELLNSGIWQGENSWEFGPLTPVNEAKLLQFYRMPDLSKSQYVTRDLCNLKRTIRFLGDTFESNEDLINITYEKGLTLCIKANLQNMNPKSILYKSNLTNDIYMSLTLLNQTLTFTLAGKSKEVSVSKAISLDEYDSYTKEPIMLTIFITPQYEDWFYMQMFRNNEPITENKYVQLNKTIDPSIYVLSNYIENMPTYEAEDEEGHIITKTVEPGKYVEGIVVIEGIINKDYLLYINNLFDTDY